MVVLYYTQTYFLDATLETIQSIKHQVELHIIIELSQESKTSTIVDIDSLDGLGVVEKCEYVLGRQKWKTLEKYFEGVASIEFLVFKHRKAFSFATFKNAFLFSKHIQQINPSVIHFDSLSLRAAALCFFIKSKKIFITIHDPVRHSGEKNWKSNIPLKLFSRLVKGYFFYSEFARKQFRVNYAKNSAPLFVIKFQPYSYVSQFQKNINQDGTYILFFGRFSLYKGIDLLLAAIPEVLQKFPDQQFLIAGKPEGYKLDINFIEKFKNNISVVSKYLSVEELVQCIADSKFVVCPYRDATQSGVLMTARALGKMVVATNIGAFPEYINENVNGLLSAPQSKAIAAKIIQALNNDQYKKITHNIKSSYSEETATYNRIQILTAYQNG
jgi:glycosyltransferase involved in cell wall biosynthesis